MPGTWHVARGILARADRYRAWGALWLGVRPPGGAWYAPYDSASERHVWQLAVIGELSYSPRGFRRATAPPAGGQAAHCSIKALHAAQA